MFKETSQTASTPQVSACYGHWMISEVHFCKDLKYHEKDLRCLQEMKMNSRY